MAAAAATASSEMDACSSYRTDPSSSSSATASRCSVHRSLGGGAVADVLLWRRKNAATALAVGTTTAWVVFVASGYSLSSVVVNSLLLLVIILFLWAKSASVLNRPLPPLPNLEISDAAVEKAAAETRVWINRVLSIGHDIAIKRDRKVFLQVILVLWLVSYIGNFFNFLTLICFGVMLSLSAPALYDKYQDQVDDHIGRMHKVISKQYNYISSNRSGQQVKEKKIQ